MRTNKGGQIANRLIHPDIVILNELGYAAPRLRLSIAVHLLSGLGWPRLRLVRNPKLFSAVPHFDWEFGLAALQ